MTTLYIVVPCYNEEEVLPITAPQFLDKIHNLTERGGLMEIKYSIAVEHTVTGRNCFKIQVRRKH